METDTSDLLIDLSSECDVTCSSCDSQVQVTSPVTCADDDLFNMLTKSDSVKNEETNSMIGRSLTSISYFDMLSQGQGGHETEELISFDPFAPVSVPVHCTDTSQVHDQNSRSYATGDVLGLCTEEVTEGYSDLAAGSYEADNSGKRSPTKNKSKSTPEELTAEKTKMSQRTNLNRRMEKSFEDLLMGLDEDEEAEPDLDDIMTKCDYLPEKVTDDTFNDIAIQNQMIAQKKEDVSSAHESEVMMADEPADEPLLLGDTQTQSEDDDNEAEKFMQLPRIPHQGESKTEEIDEIESSEEDDKDDEISVEVEPKKATEQFLQSQDKTQEPIITLQTSGETNTDDLHDDADLASDRDETEKMADDQKDLTLFSGLDQDDSDPDIDNIIANCEFLPESVTDRTINAMVMNNQSHAKSFSANEEKMRSDSSEEEEGEEDPVVVRMEVTEPDEDADFDLKDENGTDGERALKRDPSLDFSVLEDTSHLSVDIGKHKTNLRKKGSLARRRKPTRENVRSALLSGEETHFVDSTEPRPKSESMENGDVEEPDNVFGSERSSTSSADGIPMSPPAKKPSHEGRIPLPGLGMPKPKPRTSSGNKSETDMIVDDTPKKNYKSYGVKLPVPQLRPVTKDKADIEMESESVFGKPDLKKVRKPSEEKESEKEPDHRFSMPELRKVHQDRQSTEALKSRKGSETESDKYFEKPPLKQVGRGDAKSRVSPETETAHVFEKPPLKNVSRRESETGKSSETEKKFEKPMLRTVSRDQMEVTKPAAEKDSSFVKPQLKTAPKPYLEQPVTPKSPEAKTFDIPALKKTPKVNRSQDSVGESRYTSGSFEKPALRLVSKPPVPGKVDNSEQDSENRYKFDMPGLRKVPRDHKPTETLRNMTNNDTESDPMNFRTSLKATPKKESARQSESKTAETPSWLKDMKLKRTKSQAEDVNADSDVRNKESEKPSWLQSAADKRSKALDVLHSKENQSDRDTANKVDMEWSRKTPNGQPLQDSTESHTNHIHSENIIERQRLSSVESDRSSKERTPVKETKKDQYVPSWMKKKETQHQSSPSLKFVSPTGVEGDELPQWKRDLAERRKSRRESDVSTKNSEEKSESALPPWKAELAQKKMKPATPVKSSAESRKSEPEWKQKADEKRQRIIKSGIFDRTLRKTE